MWSPKQKADGTRSQFYQNMREVSRGDVVFSFCDTRIKAIGVVTGGAQTGPKPDLGNAGLNWSKEGWFVPVDYCVLNKIRFARRTTRRFFVRSCPRSTRRFRKAETVCNRFTWRRCRRPSPTPLSV